MFISNDELEQYDHKENMMRTAHFNTPICYDVGGGFRLRYYEGAIERTFILEAVGDIGGC